MGRLRQFLVCPSKLISRLLELYTMKEAPFFPLRFCTIGRLRLVGRVGQSFNRWTQ